MASILTVSYRSALYSPAPEQEKAAVPFSVSDSEFAKDMALLTNGGMSPEAHRLYIAQKYGQDF